MGFRSRRPRRPRHRVWCAPRQRGRPRTDSGVGFGTGQMGSRCGAIFVRSPVAILGASVVSLPKQDCTLTVAVSSPSELYPYCRSILGKSPARRTAGTDPGIIQRSSRPPRGMKVLVAVAWRQASPWRNPGGMQPRTTCRRLAMAPGHRTQSLKDPLAVGTARPIGAGICIFSQAWDLISQIAILPFIADTSAGGLLFASSSGRTFLPQG